MGGRKRRSFACFSQQAGGCFPCGKNSSGFMSDQDIQIPGAFGAFSSASSADASLLHFFWIVVVVDVVFVALYVVVL